MNRFGVVMAGGAGARLWPLSREKRPKQFIRAGGDTCMLVQTIKRLLGVVAPGDCFVITNRELADITRDTVSGIIPAENILLEPIRKNTAACIAFAAMAIRQRRGPGVLCCVPSDGYVKDCAGYTQAVALALDTAGDAGGLVLIGIVPAYPSTGYGYIRIDKHEPDVSGVYGFFEKPDEETAREMVNSKEYLWNGGIVAGDMDVIAECVHTHLPGHYAQLSAAIAHLNQPDYDACIADAYAHIENISFDFGVLEKCEELRAVKGRFDWDDIGSLDKLLGIIAPDGNGNVAKGAHFLMDTCDSLVYSADGILTAAIGLEGMIVAATKDAVIVCPRGMAQQVKHLVEKLKENGLDGYV